MVMSSEKDIPVSVANDILFVIANNSNVLRDLLLK
jgi:hypothetical protein